MQISHKNQEKEAHCHGTPVPEMCNRKHVMTAILCFCLIVNTIKSKLLFAVDRKGDEVKKKIPLRLCGIDWKEKGSFSLFILSSQFQSESKMKKNKMFTHSEGFTEVEKENYYCWNWHTYTHKRLLRYNRPLITIDNRHIPHTWFLFVMTVSWFFKSSWNCARQLSNKIIEWFSLDNLLCNAVSPSYFLEVRILYSFFPPSYIIPMCRIFDAWFSCHWRCVCVDTAEQTDKNKRKKIHNKTWTKYNLRDRFQKFSTI